MSRLLTYAALAGLTFSQAACDGGASAGNGPRHLVLVVVDTLRADALLDPAELVDTPHIDRFANEGVAFVETLAHAPMTLPSHTAMFSSRPPHRNGVLNNGQAVPSDLPLFPQHLASLGFDTLGVFSLGTLGRYHGANTSLDRGFEEYHPASAYVASSEQALALFEETFSPSSNGRSFVFFHVADPHEPYNDRSTAPSTATVTLDGEPLTEPVNISWMTEFSEELALAAGEHVLTFEADRAISLRSLELYHRGEPIELDRETFARPAERLEIRFEVPEGRGRVDLKFWVCDAPTNDEIAQRYMSEVEYADRYFGDLTELLRAEGVLDDCLLVFTSDHGEALGEHGSFAHVETVYEEMIHVPLFFWASEQHRGILDRLQSGATPASHMDVVPTILDLLGLPALPGQEGRSLASDPGPFLHVAETHPPEAKRNVLCLRDDDRKLIYFPDEDRFELYDLGADPTESTDVFASQRATVVEWQKDLRRRAGEAFEAQRDAGDLSPEMLERLRALGYFGD